ncbi:MAG: NAD(P)-dependent oxidoreductase [Kiloniellaceae bacterium]
MLKVLVAGAIHEAGRALLDARDDVDVEALGRLSVADLEARIADLDALVLRLTPVRAGTIARARRLKVVSRFGVGYDNVDVDALTRHGIPLAIVGDANAVPVAEHALALILALTRRLIAHDHAVHVGDYGVRDGAAQSELWRKTVLVVGFGRVGRRVARRCAAFDMHVVAADPYLARESVETEGYRYVDDFRAALGEADIVTLHLPATPDGRPVMGRREFEAMKPGGYFINVARGSLVDEDALADALSRGRLRGAGLDVTRQEPPARDSPLLRLSNVILTPHCAALTEECARRMSVVSVQNALDGLDGRLKPELVVNKEVLG